jgi:hypothetical protein
MIAVVLAGCRVTVGGETEYDTGAGVSEKCEGASDQGTTRYETQEIKTDGYKYKTYVAVESDEMKWYCSSETVNFKVAFGTPLMPEIYADDKRVCYAVLEVDDISDTGDNQKRTIFSSKIENYNELGKMEYVNEKYIYPIQKEISVTAGELSFNYGKICFIVSLFDYGGNEVLGMGGMTHVYYARDLNNGNVIICNGDNYEYAKRLAGYWEHKVYG